MSEPNAIQEVDLDTLLEGEPVTKVATPLSLEEIRAMIQQLSVTENGEPLRKAMDELKVALHQNPTACAIMFPEEIGAMVTEIYRLTGKQLEDAVKAASKRGAGKEKLPDLKDPKVQQTILDDLD